MASKDNSGDILPKQINNPNIEASAWMELTAPVSKEEAGRATNLQEVTKERDLYEKKLKALNLALASVEEYDRTVKEEKRDLKENQEFVAKLAPAKRTRKIFANFANHPAHTFTPI